MERDSEPSGDAQLDVNDVITAVGQTVDELERLLAGAAKALPDGSDRARLVGATRRRLRCTLAVATWHLRRRLETRDDRVLRALVDLEHEEGEPFPVSAGGVAYRADVSTSTVYAALGRLEYLGLVDWARGCGPVPARVRLDHGRFRLATREGRR